MFMESKQPNYPKGGKIRPWHLVRLDSNSKIVKKVNALLKKDGLGPDPWLRNYYQQGIIAKRIAGYRAFWDLRHGFLFGAAIVFLIHVRREWYPSDYPSYFPNGDTYLTLKEKEEGVDYKCLDQPKHYSRHME
ncbi:uncharacterized protein LOC141850291 [Brevipalpus obovatus]|uniref:uncharacterized protein LOC141850291 n=1 Tax=Brevipalpus obovatus TaxID=246614 RepID=UPI003D9DC85B